MRDATVDDEMRVHVFDRKLLRHNAPATEANVRVRCLELLEIVRTRRQHAMGILCGDLACRCFLGADKTVQIGEIKLVRGELGFDELWRAPAIDSEVPRE